MTILKTVYASAPEDELILITLEIRLSPTDVVRVVQGFENHMLGVDGVYQEFTASAISVALPSSNTSGQQTLRFSIGGINSLIQRHIDAALESSAPITLIYREYLESDKSAPARQPYIMTISGIQLEGDEAQIEASYWDILNYSWPRQRYTEETAPGIKYL